MLSDHDRELIDNAAKSLLENPGVRVEDEQLVSALLSRGAKPGGGPMDVRFPRAMVEEYLGMAPESFPIADRRGNIWTVTPEGGPLFWTGAALFYSDREGFRHIKTKDLGNFAKVIDSLSEVDAVVGTSLEDVKPSHRDFVGLRIMAENTSKHLRTLSFTPKGGEAMVEMGKVLAGERNLRDYPVFSVGFTAHGPLRWTSLALGLFKATAGHGVPCTVNGEPMSGATAPVTVAGTVTVGTAEILSGIVINQVMEQGRPCFFNLGFAHVMDMRSGFAVTGGPENIMLAVAGAEMARYYHLPSVSWMCTDSLHFDSQNALEKAMAALAHAQAKVSVIWGVGQLESEKTISPVQAVIDNEIVGMTRKYLLGFEVNDETISLDEIRKVGITGDYLQSEKTFKYFRGSVFEPRFLVRKQRSSAGERDTLKHRAVDYVDNIIAEEKEPILSEEQKRELKRIENKYRELIP
ncbi:MAG: hypothetical protein DRP87_01695 [Spirochaetes bacterium]|nr:MAG: hypothetical protein DRP87_01695 [Spirochaetota bacterium]